MQASTTVPAAHSNLLLWALAVLGVGLLSLLPLVVLDGGPSTTAVAPASANYRVAYLEFGRETDTLWVADVANPSKRERLFAVGHAAEFGIVPSLAPGRRSFAFTALPANTRSPTPETPAELWLASLETDSKPRLIAQNADLLVAPVWSPAGDTIVFRRSRTQSEAAPSGQRLIALDIASGQERQLVTSSGPSVFAVGYSSDERSLFYVSLDATGSALLAVDLTSGSERQVARLGDGLTRDWKLSPTGHRLAYLAMKLDGGSVASRAFVLDLASGVSTPLSGESDAFNPTWATNGELAIGTLGADDEADAAVIRFSATGESQITHATTGFDVPLGFEPTGERLAVRSFDSASTISPGRERLDVVLPNGVRKTITTAEVTFLGWIDP